MNKNQKMLLVFAVIAVGIYLAVRWYENNQANQNGTAQGGAGLGTNLNSVAPELVGGSTGPSIGPALSTPITINVTESQPDTSEGANPTGKSAGYQLTSAGVTTPSALGLANPSNGFTGNQAATPVASDVSGGNASATSAGTGVTYRTPTVSRAEQPTTRTATPLARSGSTAAAEPKANTPGRAKPLKRAGMPKQKKASK